MSNFTNYDVAEMARADERRRMQREQHLTAITLLICACVLIAVSWCSGYALGVSDAQEMAEQGKAMVKR